MPPKRAVRDGEGAGSAEGEADGDGSSDGVAGWAGEDDCAGEGVVDPGGAGGCSSAQAPSANATTHAAATAPCLRHLEDCMGLLYRFGTQ